MVGHNQNIVGGALRAGTEVVVPESRYKPIKQLTTAADAFFYFGSDGSIVPSV